MEAGLIGLKAELHKKRAEIRQQSANNDVKNFHARPFPKVEKVKTAKAAKRSPTLISDEVSDDEKKKLEKSRTILEQKAALYEKLKEGTDVLESDELNDKYLVNFQKKIENCVEIKRLESEKKSEKEIQKSREALHPNLYAPKDEDEEWVEYVDSFGRTRTCLRIDLESLESKTEQETSVKDMVNKAEKNTMGHFHTKWSAEQDEADKKDSVHYQDVLFDEARAHGVGFMNFSRDENERRAQQNDLSNLRKETIAAEISKRDADKQKKSKMAERLAKVRQRKRLKLGLPCADPMEERLKTPPPSDDEAELDETVRQKVEQEINRQEREMEHKLKAAKMREWDVGKKTNDGSLLTQEQWVEQKRQEREAEFAPPSAGHQYTVLQNDFTCADNATGSSDDKQTLGGEYYAGGSSFSDVHEHISSESQNEEQSCKNQSFAPPSTYEYYGPSSSLRGKCYKSKKFTINESIEKGLSHLRKSS